MLMYFCKSLKEILMCIVILLLTGEEKSYMCSVTYTPIINRPDVQKAKAGKHASMT